MLLGCIFHSVTVKTIMVLLYFVLFFDLLTTIVLCAAASVYLKMTSSKQTHLTATQSINMFYDTMIILI